MGDYGLRKILKNTNISPSHYLAQSFWKDTYYGIVNPSSAVLSEGDQDAMPLVMWSLNVRTKKWQMQGQLKITEMDFDPIVLANSESTHMKRDVWLFVSDNDTILLTSDHMQPMTHNLPPRFMSTLVAINSSLALQF